jgi:TusA-related sulfurtransferase
VQLSQSLYQCMNDLQRGELLLVISKVPESRYDVPRWCGLTEHDLVCTEPHEHETLFWVVKR